MNVQTFPSVMADLPVNLDHPNRTLISGLFRESAPVNGTKREFFTYIPKDLDYDSQCLVVAVPSGTAPETYFEEVGLKDFAEKHRLFLHLHKIIPFIPCIYSVAHYLASLSRFRSSKRYTFSGRSQP